MKNEDEENDDGNGSRVSEKGEQEEAEGNSSDFVRNENDNDEVLDLTINCKGNLYHEIKN